MSTILLPFSRPAMSISLLLKFKIRII
uniref:Uncharacterized protein n=1 Tax=Arundo donax TaxID=35708 RepID=A0A0A9AX09_ARUDO